MNYAVFDRLTVEPSCCHAATFIYYTDISNEEPRLYPTENLEASGAAGKLRLSKLYCSERREPSGRFSVGTAEANRIRRSQRGNSEAVFFSMGTAEAI